jgi:hypothetical protein
MDGYQDKPYWLKILTGEEPMPPGLLERIEHIVQKLEKKQSLEEKMRDLYGVPPPSFSRDLNHSKKSLYNPAK